ncbi:MAG: FAD-dependent oxidoreductase [Planctomycetes bacterium]|nr:FAD-dependent oxidoreductase [Planctomycetota bacterium]
MTTGKGQWTRREFLAGTTGIAAAGIGGYVLEAQEKGPAPPSPASLKVVVVGAGLAGLACAYELEKKGHRAVVFEAERDHVGGRVRTFRFGDGSYGEFGPTLIPESHALTKKYAQEFGLTLRPFVETDPNTFYYFRNQKVQRGDVAKLYPRFPLSAQECAMPISELSSGLVEGVIQDMTDEEKEDLFRDVPVTEKIRRYERLSAERFFEEFGLSADVIDLMFMLDGRENFRDHGICDSLRSSLQGIRTQALYEIEGGMDRLTAAFADRLREKPRTGCPVVGIAQSGDREGVRVTVVRGDRRETEDGDFAICTVPFPVLSRVRFDPPISREKARAVQELRYEGATKVLTQCRRRFWEEQGIYGGGTITDLPTGSTLYPSDNAQARDPAVSRGPGVMVSSFCFGSASHRLGLLSPEERAEVVLSSVSEIHPELREREMALKTVGWTWETHPWTGGAFSGFRPGQQSRLHPHVIAPEGRVHFAGEHTSLDHGWMQGALESAQRAVRQVLQASQK